MTTLLTVFLKGPQPYRATLSKEGLYFPPKGTFVTYGPEPDDVFVVEEVDWNVTNDVVEITMEDEDCGNPSEIAEDLQKLGWVTSRVG